MDNKEATKTIIFLVLLIVLWVILFARFSAVPAVELPEPTVNPPVEESATYYSGRNAVSALPAGVADATLSITASRYSFQKERIIFDELETAAPKKTKETLQPAEKPQPAEEPQAETLESVVVNEEEVEMLACLIYQEAGGNAASDTARYMVGDVVLNRIESDKFPNTMQARGNAARRPGAKRKAARNEEKPGEPGQDQADPGGTFGQMRATLHRRHPS